VVRRCIPRSPTAHNSNCGLGACAEPTKRGERSRVNRVKALEFGADDGANLLDSMTGEGEHKGPGSLGGDTACIKCGEGVMVNGARHA